MSEMERHLIRVRVCRQDDLPALRKAAEVDGHAVIAPTYIVEKGDAIVGYVGVIPAGLVWLDTEMVKGRESLLVLNTLEIQLALGGNNVMALPCVHKSPLRPFLERLGYVDTGETKLFLKGLYVHGKEC